MRKLRISIEITNDDGKKLVEAISEKEVPYMKEFERDGFEAAFDQLETAVLEARKETSQEAVSKYVSKLSKKKRNAQERLRNPIKSELAQQQSDTVLKVKSEALRSKHTN